MVHVLHQSLRSPPPKSGSPKRGFRRLNSMEDPIGASMQHSPTWPGDRNSSEPMSRQYNQIHDMQKTEAETKWFGSYGEEDHLQPSHPHHQDVRHYHPAAMDSWTKYQTQPKRPSLPHSRSFSAGASSPAEISFQRPFNVNKRRYEDFPMLVEGGHMSPLLNQHLHYNNQPNHQVAARQMASSLPVSTFFNCTHEFTIQIMIA